MPFQGLGGSAGMLPGHCSSLVSAGMEGGQRTVRNCLGRTSEGHHVLLPHGCPTGICWGVLQAELSWQSSGARGHSWLWLDTGTAPSCPQPALPSESFTCLWGTDNCSLSKHSSHSVGQTHQGRLPHRAGTGHTWELLVSLCALCKHFLWFSQLQ